MVSDTGGTLTYWSLSEIALPNDVAPQPEAIVSVQFSYVYFFKKKWTDE